MTVSVWRIATDTPTYTSDDLSGEGAKVTGGRWNRAGMPVVYTSESIALSCMETLVHLKAGGLPLNRYLIRIDIPDPVWHAAKIFDVTTLPVGWDAIPEGKVSLDLGDQWLKSNSSALLAVASVIIPHEYDAALSDIKKNGKSGMVDIFAASCKDVNGDSMGQGIFTIKNISAVQLEFTVELKIPVLTSDCPPL